MSYSKPVGPGHTLIVLLTTISLFYLEFSVPDNFFEQLQLHAAMGFRVLGLAYREFDKKFTWRKSQRIDRQEVEKDLIFLGFILLHNKLKPVSTGVVNDLREANVRCVMVTGTYRRIYLFTITYGFLVV